MHYNTCCSLTYLITIIIALIITLFGILMTISGAITHNLPIAIQGFYMIIFGGPVTVGLLMIATICTDMND